MWGASFIPASTSANDGMHAVVERESSGIGQDYAPMTDPVTQIEAERYVHERKLPESRQSQPGIQKRILPPKVQKILSPTMLHQVTKQSVTCVYQPSTTLRLAARTIVLIYERLFGNFLVIAKKTWFSTN